MFSLLVSSFTSKTNAHMKSQLSHDELKSYLSPHKNGQILYVKVKPKAGSESLSLNDYGQLVLRVKSPAHKGAANARVIECLALLLLIPKSKIEIIKGQLSSLKCVLIRK